MTLATQMTLVLIGKDLVWKGQGYKNRGPLRVPGMNIHLTPIAGLPLKALGGGAVIGETVRMAIQDGENVSSRI